MHVLQNKNTGEISVYKYVTPTLNGIMGYSEQHFRRIATKNDKIETENYILTFNCYYDGGKRGGLRYSND